jgi:hypothetical protein
MSAQLDPIKAFRYVPLSDGIHELIFYEGTAEALEACFTSLDDIFFKLSADEPLLLLSDIRQSGTPPIGPLVSLARRLLRKYPRHPMPYNAVLHSEEGRIFRAFALVMEQLAGLYLARVRFFSASERDQAMMWLLEKRGTNGKPPRAQR